MKRPNETLMGVPPPPPVRRSMPTIPAVLPPPPVRRSAPTLPALRAVRNDLALSQTVLAPTPPSAPSAPEVAVPEELQAAVLVPPPSRPAAPPAMAAPTPVPAQGVMPPPLPPAAATPAPSPYPALPAEKTPAIAASAIDVPLPAVRLRPRFRARTVVAVAAIGVGTGLGLTLLIGHGTRDERTAVDSPRSSPARTPAAPAVSPAAAKASSAPAAAVAQPVPAAAPAPRKAPESRDVPVASSTVPSCKEMLGSAFVEKNDPTAALAESKLANRELVRGNADASQAAFCKAALWDGEKIERWLNLSQIFLIRRDDRKALESVERAVELDPKNARALEIRGDAEARLGNLETARKAYLDAERRPEPDEAARAWLIRRDMDEAQRSMKARDFVRAERLFRRVVVFDSEHPGAALGVSTCLRKQGDQTTADAWAERAEKLARRAAGKGF